MLLLCYYCIILCYIIIYYTILYYSILYYYIILLQIYQYIYIIFIYIIYTIYIYNYIYILNHDIKSSYIIQRHIPGINPQKTLEYPGVAGKENSSFMRQKKVHHCASA